jgi:hypothetical protein
MITNTATKAEHETDAGNGSNDLCRVINTSPLAVA